MAVNAYLFIDGVEGPSTSKTGHIDVLSFSWGVSQTIDVWRRRFR